jgi:hypothetical protein
VRPPYTPSVSYLEGHYIALSLIWDNDIHDDGDDCNNDVDDDDDN